MLSNKLFKYLLLPLLLAVILFLVSLATRTGDNIVIPVILILSIITIALLVRQKPLYTIATGSLHIHGVINQKIAYTDIKEIRRISNEELGIGTRYGLSFDGLRQGIFIFNSVGEVMVHCNNAIDMVLIRTHDKQYIITVPYPDEFITTIISRK